MAVIGELSLWVALLMATWAAFVSFTGGSLDRRDLIESGRRAIYATLVMVALASAGLWTALFTHDLSIRYVASFSSANLPKIYLVSAFWTGLPGSMLFWCLLLSLFSSIVVFNDRLKRHEMMPYISGTLACLMLCLLATMCFAANPFDRLEWIPQDGRGMNPVLQNLGMVIYQPTLYIGYAATSVPFAFAVVSRAGKGFDAESGTAIRRWTTAAWLFTTLGILLGMWSAYGRAGWDSSWALQPIKNGSVLPWLAISVSLLKRTVSRNRSRAGGYIVGLGVAAIIAALTGVAMSKDYELNLREGGSKELIDPFGHKWQFLSQGLSQYSVLNRDVTALALDLARDGKRAGVLSTENREYLNSKGARAFDALNVAGVRRSWAQDIYVILEGVREDTSVDVRVAFNPLIQWLWLGGALVAIGGVIAAWPHKPHAASVS